MKLAARFISLIALMGFTQDVMSQHATERAYLGIHMENRTDDAKTLMGIPGADGVIITEVVLRSTAEKAGFKTGDLLCTLSGRPVRSTEDVFSILKDQRAGTAFEYELLRNKKPLKGNAVFQSRPNDVTVAANTDGYSNGERHTNMKTRPVERKTVHTPSLIYEVEGFECAYPRLSRDDSKILYQSNRSGKWQLAIMNLADSTHRQLTADSSNNFFPDWSPDNSRITFVSDRDGDEEVYLMDADGGNLRNITNHKSRDIHPYFSPDGSFILFSSDRGNGSLDIFRYEIATGKTMQLTNTADDETCARYSGDMKQIVYLRNGTTGDDVYLINTSTFLPENLTRTPAIMDGWPMFSDHDAWIYYSSMLSGTYCVYRMKCDGSEVEQITVADPGAEDARVFVAHKNDRIVFNKRKGKTISILSAPVGK